MKITLDLDYHDAEGAGFDKGDMEGVIIATLERSRFGVALEEKKISLSVAIIGDEEIQRVNERYRGCDSSTDVISIGDYSDDKDVSQEEASSFFLGEVLLCWDYIEKSATIQEVHPVFELCYVLSHGVLHLLGYEHSEEMFALQEGVAKQYCDRINTFKNEK